MLLKYLFWAFVFLLPWHALVVTYTKCKLWIDPTFLRFWKEGFIAFFFIFVVIATLWRNKWNLSKIYQGNYILWVTTIFALCSFIYIFFPYLTLKPSSILGFKYDVFFLFAMVIWMYLISLKQYTSFLLKSLFTSTLLMLWVFLTWYLFFDISATTTIFWFSDKVSTFSAHGCLSFSQNVNGHHRFQATFWWPIRLSVFLVITYILFLGYMLASTYKTSIKIWSIALFSLPIFIWVFYSYSKTSFLGMLFAIILFSYISWRYLYKGKFSKKYLILGGGIFITVFTSIAIIKRDLFLHLWAILNRLDNLAMSVEMFFYNPIGYGLWIAWPATQIGTSIESAGSWWIATASPDNVHTFLPENWFVQILLEQWIFWFFIFIGLLLLIGYTLLEIIKRKRDFYSVGIFTAFVALAFMWLFTHSYEEAATSYILFLLIWIHLAKNTSYKV